MLRIGNYIIFITPILMLITSLAIFGQTPSPSVEQKKSSVRFTAQFEIGGKIEKLDRKRFYLVRGTRQQNAGLLKSIAETSVASRDCYYADLRRGGRKISDEFFCWLKTNDCESPYCREVKTKEEALSVPEFAAAYNVGLREYKQSALALKWITTNLPDDIRDGYYRQQKNILGKLIDLAKSAAQEVSQTKKDSAAKGDGFQSIMTDRLGNAYFLDINVVPPEGKKTETYLITNLLPTVFGDTGYVWSCEVEIDSTKQIQINLKNELGKKKCDVVSKKLTEVCALPDCNKPSEKPAESK